MSLRSLSDSQILSRIHDLVRQEREVTLQVLLHLNELERRSLHLKAGYSSLFDYCTAKLGYSSSSAFRRIKTARCLERFAQVQDLLQKNEVNLSTVAQVSAVLTDENHVALLSRIRGKSQREVEAIVAEYQPGAMPRDRVRTVVVRVPAPPLSNGGSDHTHVPPLSNSGGDRAPVPFTRIDETRACEKGTYCRNGSESGEANARLETRVLLQFAAREGFMDKLERVRSLAWHRLGANAPLEEVFELLMDTFIAKEDPEKRIERRRARKPRAAASTSAASRHVPAAVRDKVFQRDSGRCTYVGSGGHRCNSTVALQVDHVAPFARGGSSTTGNLRLLCGYHNRLEAERLLGFDLARSKQEMSPRSRTV